MKKTTYIFKINKGDDDRIFLALTKFKRVKFGKLGVFEIRQIKSRTGWDPSKKETKTISGYKKLAFKPTQMAKDKINGIAPIDDIEMKRNIEITIHKYQMLQKKISRLILNPKNKKTIIRTKFLKELKIYVDKMDTTK